MPSKIKQISNQMRTRSFARVPSSVDIESKSFGIVISTENPVRTWIQNPEKTDELIEVDEILLASGFDSSRTFGMPLVDCHQTFTGISQILGKVDDVRTVENEIHGTAVLNSRNSDLITDISNGHYAQISAGYGVISYEIDYRQGDVPIAYATAWTLYEASLVAVGADPNASVRSAGRTIPVPKFSFRNKPLKAKKSFQKRNKLENKKMDEAILEELIAVAEDAMAAVEEAVVAVENAVEEFVDELPDDLAERARKLRNMDEEDDTERKRSKRETDDEEDTERRRGKREDTEDEKKEEDEIRSIRSIAKSYGLTKAVDDLVALGTRSKDLKTSIRSAIMQKALINGSGSRSDNIEPRKRSSEPKLTSARDIYGKMNKR